MTFLQIKDVHKSYNNEQNKALRGISLSVNQGEVLGLIGESGCGKTTLARLLAGLETLDKGQMLLEKKRIPGPEDKLVAGHDDIALVHQHFDLFPHHTAFENVLSVIKGYHEDEEKEAQAMEVLQICRIAGEAERLPRQLSGGQKQRLALARALVNQPKLLVMDEPFANLDTPLKNEIVQELREIFAAFGTTAVFITHDAGDALDIADRIAILKEGKLLQLDRPEKLYYKPVDSYVAKFLGNVNIKQGNEIGMCCEELKDSSGSYAIRCEHIQLVNKSPFPGKVIERHFRGSYTLLKIADASLREWWVSCQTTTPTVGATVYMSLEKENVHLLAD